MLPEIYKIHSEHIKFVLMYLLKKLLNKFIYGWLLLWLYCGAWQEGELMKLKWQCHEPDQVLKRHGISQTPNPKRWSCFQEPMLNFGKEPKIETTKQQLYQQLGFSNYAAMEAFVRWHY